MDAALELARLNSAAGFGQALGLVFDHAEPGLVRGHLDIGPQHLQPFGLVNGGVWCALVETFGSIGGVISSADEGKLVVGVSNTTDFIRSVRDGRVEVEATPIHLGRLQHLWQVLITRGDGQLVARGQVRLQLLDPPPGTQVPHITAAP